MKRLVLFRYHDHFDICAQRIMLLRALNPHIPIHGLYGGARADSKAASKLDLDHFYAIPMDDPYWKWVNGDLCIRWWFRDYGHQQDFDFVHVLEWDMLLLDSIESLFGQVKNGIALGVMRNDKSFLHNWLWTRPGRGGFELQRLQALVKKTHGALLWPAMCFFGGSVFCREFLEQYLKEEIHGLCNDEVRVSMYAQAFGMKIHDNNLQSAWFKEIGPLDQERLDEGYKEGIRAFHPVRFMARLPSAFNTD